jgi:hypothetical protein
MSSLSQLSPKHHSTTLMTRTSASHSDLSVAHMLDSLDVLRKLLELPAVHRPRRRIHRARRLLQSGVFSRYSLHVDVEEKGSPMVTSLLTLVLSVAHASVLKSLRRGLSTSREFPRPMPSYLYSLLSVVLGGVAFRCSGSGSWWLSVENLLCHTAVPSA